MKKFLTYALAAVLALGAGSVAYANVCAVDQVPAATLLYPFVVLDYNGGSNGTTTLFSVTNVSAEAQIVHFVLWTDYSYHVLDWNVLLSGYDVQTMNIRDILMNGVLPSTGTVSGVDDTTWNNNGNPVPAFGPRIDAANLPPSDSTTTLYDRCNPGMTAYPSYGPMPASFLDTLKGWLQRSQVAIRGHYDCELDSFFSDPAIWWEQRTTADPTWMYITADVVWTCNRLFPDATEYWTPGPANNPSYDENGAQAMYDNTLIGDIFYVNADQNLSEAVPAVSLETAPELDGFITFYNAYTLAAGGSYSDLREPLPNGWGVRYIFADTEDVSGTSVRVFKRSTEFTTVADLYMVDFPYPSQMYAYNCRGYLIYAFDEDENVITSTPDPDDPWSPPPCIGEGCEAPNPPNQLPLETQEVAIEQLPHVDMFGWIWIVWPGPGGLLGDDYYQTYVSVKYNYGGYSMALPGAVLNSDNCFVVAD